MAWRYLCCWRDLEETDWEIGSSEFKVFKTKAEAIDSLRRGETDPLELVKLDRLAAEPSLDGYQLQLVGIGRDALHA